MTLRQVLAIVWQRRVLALITAVLVFLSALAYALVAPVTYSSTSVVRMSPAASSTLEGGTGYGSIYLDIDPDYASSPEIAKAAAKLVPGDTAEAIQGAVTVTVETGVRSNKLSLTATGSTAEQATDRANAVAEAYVGHLDTQLATGIKRLNTQLQTQKKEQASALAALAKNGQDQLAQQRFNDASTQVTQIQTEITAVQSAGKPASVYQAATPGERQGMSLVAILAIGLISGIIAGAGVALIRHQFDDRLHTVEDVEGTIHGHVLGDVATVSRQELATHPLPAASRIPTPFNESIRAMRTSLQVVFPQPHSVIVLTSSEPGEGKTFLSANLAVSFAHAGRKVVLIEGDLRRPRLGTYFAIPTGARGFANALDRDADEATISSWLVDSGFGGLHILPAGASRREPADLLASHSLETVLDRIRGMADTVIVDTPPGLALADAAIIGREADGVVLITSLNKTTSKSLADTLQLLRANRTEVVGVIANRSKRATVKSYMDYYTAESGSVNAAAQGTGIGAMPERALQEGSTGEIPVQRPTDATGSLTASPAVMAGPPSQPAPVAPVIPVLPERQPAPEQTPTEPATAAPPAAPEPPSTPPVATPVPPVASAEATTTAPPAVSAADEGPTEPPSAPTPSSSAEEAEPAARPPATPAEDVAPAAPPSPEQVSPATPPSADEPTPEPDEAPADAPSDGQADDDEPDATVIAAPSWAEKPQEDPSADIRDEGEATVIAPPSWAEQADEPSEEEGDATVIAPPSWADQQSSPTDDDGPSESHADATGATDDVPPPPPVGPPVAAPVTPPGFGSDPMQDTAPRTLPWLVSPDSAAQWGISREENREEPPPSSPPPPPPSSTMPGFFAPQFTQIPTDVPTTPWGRMNPVQRPDSGGHRPPNPRVTLAEQFRARPFGPDGMPPDLFYDATRPAPEEFNTDTSTSISGPLPGPPPVDYPPPGPPKDQTKRGGLSRKKRRH